MTTKEKGSAKSAGKKVKPNPELIANLQALAAGTGKDFDKDVKPEFGKVMKEDYLATLPPSQRMEMAYRVLKARYAEQLIGEDKPFQFIVMDVGHPREIAVRDKGKKTDKKQLFAQFWAVFMDVDGDDGEEYGVVNLYRDAAKAVLKLKIGTAYEGRFNGNKKRGTYNMGTSGDKIPKMTALSEPPIKDFNAWDWLEERFNHVDIGEVQENISENPSDKKLIIGQVSDAFAGKGQSGYPFGRITMIDESLDFEDIKRMSGGLSCLVAHNQIRWATGSEIMIVGTLEDSEQYGMTHSGEVIIPRFGIPKPKVDIEKYKETSGEGDDEEPADDNDEEPPAPDDEEPDDESEAEDDDDIDLSGL